MNKNEIITSFLPYDTLNDIAKNKWNAKTIDERIKASFKYKHIFSKYKLSSNDWSNTYDGLSEHQRNILLKGQLIARYDALPNSAKTRIKKELGLSAFSSKWFKLSSRDKKILLKNVITNG